MPDNILVQQANGQWAVLAATDNAGVYTLAVTTAAANSSIVMEQANGQFVVVATVLTSGVHTLAVTSV